MARQDYVSHSPKSKKNAYKPKAEVKPVMSIKLKILIVLALICAGGFAYLLWLIKDKPPVVITTPKPVIEKAQENEPPEYPEEKWEYENDLVEREVEGGKYEVEQKGPYKMQCGSFRTRKQAEALKANIAFNGLSSKIKAVTGTSGTWYKVSLGPYERKREAEKDKHTLRRSKISGCQIWLW